MHLHSLPGPYWTHVLFTWKSKEGLKVYVNGTLSTSDPSGKVSHTYGEPHVNLVIGSEQDQTKRYENEAFDEFIIWERALTPDEVKMYFTAAVGQCVGRLWVDLGSPSPFSPPAHVRADVRCVLMNLLSIVMFLNTCSPR